MKYIILLGDGMADYPLERLGGKTPLEVAKTPNMDWIANEGSMGLIDTIPPGFKPGSDVAILTLLGYEASKHFSGRGPLEAANMGVQLDQHDIAFRCNLVTLGGGDESIMQDSTAGHISSNEAKGLITDINKRIGTDEFKFYPGVGYRHLMVWRNGNDDIETVPPHDITGKPIAAFLPKGAGSRKIHELMKESQVILPEHPVNKLRISKEMKVANSLWFWGQGRAPRLEKLTEKHHIEGGMISAVDLLNGIGIYAGLRVIRVEGATGYTDTNYLGKANEALKALEHLDYIFVHVEAPDEMGHEGNLEGKIQAIENFDEKIVGTVMRGLHNRSPHRIMVLSDHPTPIELRTHVSDPSPFAVYSSIKEENLCRRNTFSEKSAKDSGVMISPGNLLMDIFIKSWGAFIEELRR
jgi:2,3-bisphosphoglycerate-independent phosphoglycerate mutase